MIKKKGSERERESGQKIKCMSHLEIQVLSFYGENESGVISNPKLQLSYNDLEFRFEKLLPVDKIC